MKLALIDLDELDKEMSELKSNEKKAILAQEGELAVQNAKMNNIFDWAKTYASQQALIELLREAVAFGVGTAMAVQGKQTVNMNSVMEQFLKYKGLTKQKDTQP